MKILGKVAGFSALGLLVAGAGCNSGSSEKEQKKQPETAKKTNIIYILADDLGYGDLGCYGQEKIQTPNIDRLASQGMKFTNHYSGSTVSAPSRCALMTGYHTGHCYIRGNKPAYPEGQESIPDSSTTIAQVLKQAGYTTAAIGKWGLGAPGAVGDPNNQGFDYFFGYNCQREAHTYYPKHLWRNQKKVLIPENKDGQRQVYSHDLLADDALNFIRQHKDTAFFLFLPFTIPHAEIAVPENSLNQYKGKFPETPHKGGHYSAQEFPHAAFAGMVSRLDADVGRIVELIDSLGLAENTLIVFTSDNGPHLEGGADPDFFNSNGGLRGYKRDLYEGGIRVPMIARWSKTIAPGSQSDHISAFWDIFPTFAQVAGIETIPPNDGISFLPELLGKKQPEHEFLYWEFHEQGKRQAVRKGKWKAVRLDIEANPNAPLELYDLSTDPAEKNNIAAGNPEIVAEMEKLISKAHTPSALWPLPGEKQSE